MLEKLRASREWTALAFLPVNVQAKAKDWKLLIHGHDDGQRNVPAANATELSLAEQNVATAMFAERDRCASALTSHLRAYRDSLSQLQTGMDIASIRQAADDTCARLKELRARSTGDFGELRTQAQRTAQEIADFTQRNRITRSPRLPTNRPMTISLLVAFVAIETSINGIFFAPGSDFGLLGGGALALAFAIYNVAIGFLAGAFLFRQINVRSLLRATLGYFYVALTISLLICSNALVAHFRDLYQRYGDETDIHLVWSNLTYRTFSLGSVYSWLLFVAGLFFSGFALSKGYGWDDPIPGYGAHERRRLKAREAYSEERAALIEDAGQERDDFSDQASKHIERLRGASALRHQTLAARARMVAEFQAIETNLEESGQALMQIYREENERNRASPSPRHFQQRFRFLDRALSRPELRGLLVDQGLEHDADTLIAELDRLRSRVFDTFDQLIAQAPAEL